MKALHKNQVRRFSDIPNVGPAMVRDFATLNIRMPLELEKQNPFQMYQALCALTKSRQDPCVLDTFIAVVDFMNGAEAHPWWHYTLERKRQFPHL